MRPEQPAHMEDLRRPPAFQLYASDLRAQPRFMLMSLAERGALLSVLTALWVADEVPADLAALARILSCGEAELRDGFTARVKSFFAPVPGDSRMIYSPELCGQMQRLIERRKERSASGTKGAKTKWSKASRKDGSANGSADGSLSREKQNRTKQSKASLGPTQDASLAIDPWVQEYEAAEQKTADS